MKIKIIFLLLALIIGVKNQTTMGQKCEDKSIFSSPNSLSESTYSDVKFVYNKVASCASLKTADDDAICCYAKVKFKNKEADEKFTHTGCIEVTAKEYDNGIKNLVKELEDKLEENDLDENYQNIKKVDVEIDCKSKYMKLTGLFLLSLSLLL